MKQKKHKDDQSRVAGIPSGRPLGSTASSNEFTCAFCGRHSEECPYLVQGPEPAHVLICVACIAICVEIGMDRMINDFGSPKKKYIYRIETVEPLQSIDAIDPARPPSERET